MGIAAATGIPPRDVLGLDWVELVTLLAAVADMNGGGGRRGGRAG